MAQAPLSDWPDDHGPARDRFILDRVRSGEFDHDFCPLKLRDSAGNVLEVFVSCDAMKFEGVRMQMSAKVQQIIADELNAVMLTPKLVDQIYLAATEANRLRPSKQFRPITSKTDASIDHSRRVDEDADDRGASILPAFANVGKDWVIAKVIFTTKARAARKAANYGWLTPTRILRTDERAVFAPGTLAVQGVGTAHDFTHDDYSQIGRWARRDAFFNGQPVDLADVYKGEAPGTGMVSHEGPLPDFRQPGITVVAGSGPEGTGGKKKGGGRPLIGGLIGGAFGAAAGGGPGALIGAAIGGILGAASR